MPSPGVVLRTGRNLQAVYDQLPQDRINPDLLGICAGAPWFGRIINKFCVGCGH